MVKKFPANPNLFVFLILSLAGFLRLYQITSLFSFNGDVAWDYLSARNFLTGGAFPLVGIPSSVPWLHQGAFFTYFLIIILGIFHYNPVVPPVFTAIFGVFTCLLIYKIGKRYFSPRVGLWAALFYATSPEVVFFDRFPYHLSLIPFFSGCFFLVIYEAMKKRPSFFVLSAFLAGILMQFELSNLVILPILLWLSLEYRSKISFKNLNLSILAFIFPWFPKIIYDFSSGFTQTFGLAAWLIHKLIPTDFLDLQKGINLPLGQKGVTFFQYLSKIILPASLYLTVIIFCLMIFLAIANFRFKNRQKTPGLYLLLLWVFWPLVGFLIFGSPSESYLPVLFPGVAILFGFLIMKIEQAGPIGRVGSIAAIVLVTLNAFFLFNNDFLVKTDKYANVEEVAKFIINDSQGSAYNLIPLGSYAFFPSNKLNLVYLTDYLGQEPSEKKEKNIYFVYNNGEEVYMRIILEKKTTGVRKFSQMSVAKKIND